MRGMLILFGAVASFLLLAGTATAQESEAPAEGQYADAEPIVPGPDSECPGAEVVNTTTGTGNKQSPPFGISGDRFRITITVVPTSSDPDLAGVTAWIVNAQNDQDVTSVNKEGPGTESSVVNAGPGRFYLDLNTANADYSLVVEDCVDGNDAADGGGGDDDNDAGSEETLEDEVIKSTIPKGTLPNTGGSPLMLLAGTALLGTGLLVGRSVIRRAL